MIVKLECFSGHCHIASDQLGLAWLFAIWMMFVLNFETFALSLSRNSDPPIYFDPLSYQLLNFPSPICSDIPIY